VNLAPDSIAFVIEDFGGDTKNDSTLWLLRADVLPIDNKTIISESLKIHRTHLCTILITRYFPARAEE